MRSTTIIFSYFSCYFATHTHRERLTLFLPWSFAWRTSSFFLILDLFYFYFLFYSARAPGERALPASAVSGPQTFSQAGLTGWQADYTSRSIDGIGARTKLEEPASGQHHQTLLLLLLLLCVQSQLVLFCLSRSLGVRSAPAYLAFSSLLLDFSLLFREIRESIRRSRSVGVWSLRRRVTGLFCHLSIVLARRRLVINKWLSLKSLSTTTNLIVTLLFPSFFFFFLFPPFASIFYLAGCWSSTVCIVTCECWWPPSSFDFWDYWDLNWPPKQLPKR